MKVRSGFVSNSSSSSFVAIVDKEKFDQELSKLSDIEKEIIKLYEPAVNTIYGHKVYMIVDMTVQDYDYKYERISEVLSDHDIDEEECDNYYETLSNLLDKIPSEYIITGGTDC